MMSKNGGTLIREGEIAFDFIVAETDRLYLREFNIGDVGAVFAYTGDEENTEFMEWGPESREETESFVRSRLVSQLQSPRMYYDFAVCLKETGELIGSIGLYLTEDRQQADLGYIFNKAFWHCGYASEATEAMLRFGFMQLDLHRIRGVLDSEHTRCEAVVIRVGMRKEGETKSSVQLNFHGRKQWRGQKHYAMLQKEFLNRLFDAENVM